MAADRTRADLSHDDGYWSVVADFIDRHDRGEPVDPMEFSHGDPALAQRLRVADLLTNERHHFGVRVDVAVDRQILLDLQLPVIDAVGVAVGPERDIPALVHQISF